MAEISTERCTEALVLHLIIDYMMIFIFVIITITSIYKAFFSPAKWPCIVYVAVMLHEGPPRMTQDQSQDSKA